MHHLANKQRGFLAPAAMALGVPAWIVYGIIAAAAVAALAIIAWQIDDRGYERARGQFEPQVKAATLERDLARGERREVIEANARILQDFERLKATYEEAVRNLETMKVERAQAELELRKELVRVVEREKRYTAEIKRLAAIAAGPVITEDILHETDAILRSLARDRNSADARRVR